MTVPAANSRVECTLGTRADASPLNVLVGQVWGSATTAGFNLKVDGSTDAVAVWISTPPWTVTAAP